MKRKKRENASEGGESKVSDDASEGRNEKENVAKERNKS